MRILHVISDLDPSHGGVAEAVRILLEYGAETVENEVVSVDAPGAEYLSRYKATIHALGPGRMTFGYAPALLPWLKENVPRFDGVIVHGMWQYIGYAVRQAAKGRIPYFVFPHGMLDPYFRRASPGKHIKKWPYWALVDYWVLRDAERVLFTCEAEAELAKESFWLHRWRPRVVPFGAVPSEGNPKKQRDRFLARFPELAGRRYLLFLGRIHPKKGCDLLVEAFAKMATRDAGLDLVIAGPDPGGWRPELESRLRARGLTERVHWPGMLTGDVKWGAFYAAEAFVLPSHQENFGIAVAEALSCGVPVLLSDKVNIAAEIERDEAGLMERDTADGTRRLLERWMALPLEERERMSARALECFSRRYDMREGAKAVVEVLREATADGRAGAG
jgi:glycosyltransferase involved in cell wall biosynthesis